MEEHGRSRWSPGSHVVNHVVCNLVARTPHRCPCYRHRFRFVVGFGESHGPSQRRSSANGRAPGSLHHAAVRVQDGSDARNVRTFKRRNDVLVNRSWSRTEEPLRIDIFDNGVYKRAPSDGGANHEPCRGSGPYTRHKKGKRGGFES